MNYLCFTSFSFIAFRSYLRSTKNQTDKLNWSLQGETMIKIATIEYFASKILEVTSVNRKRSISMKQLVKEKTFFIVKIDNLLFFHKNWIIQEDRDYSKGMVSFQRRCTELERNNMLVKYLKQSFAQSFLSDWVANIFIFYLELMEFPHIDRKLINAN